MTSTINIIDISDKSNYDKKDWNSEGLLVFSDEWENRKKQCQNFIKATNGVYETRIHGRTCEVKEININQGKLFFQEGHIQGSNNLGIVYFGLFYKDELIAVMSLGRHSRQIAENRIVLDRFCVKSGVHVPGGASKLFKRCIEWAKNHNYDEIISFSDNRWTAGKLYQALQFTLEKEHKPDYCYVDTNNPIKRLSKQSQKKSTSKCPDGMTELEWAEVRGLKRLWDRGKKRWVFSLDPSKPSWKEKLSSKCAEQNRRGDFKQSYIRGYFKSEKCQTEIYYGSSYELRCMFLLENDPTVKSFKRCEAFIGRDNMSRNPDILITYMDDSMEIKEVKPKGKLNLPDVKEQIAESQYYADKMNYKFSIWSEPDSGLESDRGIAQWARNYIATITGNTDWIEKKKENDQKKAKKHYDTKIATDKVEIECSYCNETHYALRLTYDKNIARNGRYICEKEGGHISGSKPKPHLIKENPYAADGKKECKSPLHEGERIIPLTEFSPDKSRRDGYCDHCKICRRKKANERYNKKIN